MRRETALFSLTQIVAEYERDRVDNKNAGNHGNKDAGDLGNYEDAGTLARLALGYSPSSPTAHFVMGIIYFYKVFIDYIITSIVITITITTSVATITTFPLSQSISYHTLKRNPRTLLNIKNT